MKLWWLSFVDPERPNGKRSIGACIVEGETFIEAVELAHKMRCNPGGEVMGSEITDEACPGSSSWPRCKLMTVAEWKAYTEMANAAGEEL